MLTAFGEGVWHEAEPLTYLGLRITATMTVLEAGAGGLIVHSPVALTEARKAAVTALGRVEHLYAPNTFHHQWLDAWMVAFPNARVHAPAGLAKKRPTLRIDRFHDSGEPSGFGEHVREVPIRGFLLNETVLVHAASNTVVVADLVQNIGRPDHAWTRFYSRVMGFYDRVALSRFIRFTAFHDRSAARISVDAVLAHDFERLIMGHGAPIAFGARDILASALGFLPPAAPRALLGSGKAPRVPLAKPCG
jgi:hypothetical protein